MKITLTKSIAIQSAIAFLSFEKVTQREDIQNFLNGIKNDQTAFDNSLVDERVRAYLSEIDLLTEGDELTARGEAAAKDGSVWQKECGKYQFWYCQNDSFLENQILCIERRAASFGPKNIGKLSIHFEQYQENVLISARGNSDSKDEYCDIYLDDDIAKCIHGEQQLIENNLTLIWEWTGLETSVYSYKGQLSIGQNRQDLIHLNSKPINREAKLEDVIGSILPDWSPKSKRMKIKFDKILGLQQPYQIFFAFEIPDDKTNWEGFKVCVRNLPVQPFPDEAIKWRNFLLDAQLSTKYFSSAEFSTTVSTLNDEEGFAEYKDKLDTPSVEESLTRIAPPQHSQRNAVFWHLAAPMDLSPKENDHTK